MAGTAGGDVGAHVIFGADRDSGHAVQQGDLAQVREGIGYGPLEELFFGAAERNVRGEAGVEGRKRGEEALHFLWPRERFRIVPGLFAAREAQAPIHQIAHMGEDLFRRPGAGSGLKSG